LILKIRGIDTSGECARRAPHARVFGRGGGAGGACAGGDGREKVRSGVLTRWEERTGAYSEQQTVLETFHIHSYQAISRTGHVYLPLIFFTVASRR